MGYDEEVQMWYATNEFGIWEYYPTRQEAEERQYLIDHIHDGFNIYDEPVYDGYDELPF